MRSEINYRVKEKKHILVKYLSKLKKRKHTSIHSKPSNTAYKNCQTYK